MFNRRAGVQTLTTEPYDRNFDLDECVGQVSATYRFQLINAVSGEHKGYVTPIRGAALSHSSDRTIPRTLRLNLGVADTALIDCITDRILPTMEIGGQSYPLGRYMASDQSSFNTTNGNLGSLVFVDEMFIIDQESDEGFAPSETDTVPGALIDLLSDIVTPIPFVFDIAPSPFFATGSWSIGTQRGQIVEALATQGDYLQPWMTSDFKFKMIRTFDPAHAIPTFDYDQRKRVLRGSIVQSNDLLTAPNRFIVTSNGSGDTVITASADIAVTAPHSIPNRGFVVPKAETFQLTSQSQAQAIATGLATTRTAFERATLSTAPDPRHESWDVIRWSGVQWLEVSWSLDMTAGGEMTHEMVRAYT